MSDNFFTGNNNSPKKVKKDEVTELEAPVSKIRRTSGKVGKWLVNNHTELLAVLLICFAVLVIVTDTLELEGIFWESVISPEALILATCSYMIYLNAYVIGSDVAKKTEFTVKINNTYAEEVAKIRAKRIEYLLDIFCNEYKINELKYAKNELLFGVGFSEEQVSEFLQTNTVASENLSDEQKKALKKAQVLKPIKLNKKMLINAKNEHYDRSPIRSAGKIEAEKYRAFISKLFRVVTSITFIISISIHLTFNFTIETIIEIFLEVALMLISLFGGMGIGYKIKIKYTERLQDVVGVLYEFWEWLDLREKNEISTKNNKQL